MLLTKGLVSRWEGRRRTHRFGIVSGSLDTYWVELLRVHPEEWDQLVVEEL